MSFNFRGPLVVGLTTLAMACTASVAFADDWSSVRGGPGRNPASSFDPGLSFGTAWESSTVSAAAPSCVVKAGNRLFSMVISSNPGLVRLASFDTGSGRELWTTPTFQRTEPLCPATDGEQVYVGTGTGLVAYRTSDGGEVWRTSMQDGGVWGGPVVADGRVYAEGADSICGWTEGVQRGCTFGFSASDGSLVVRAAASRLFGSPTISGGPLVESGVVVGENPLVSYWSPREMIARSLADGAELWRDKTAMVGQPAAVAGVVYYLREPNTDNPGRYSIVAREARSGNVLWTHVLDYPKYPYEVAVGADAVYVSYYFHPDGNFPGQVIALDRASGQEKWATSSTTPGTPNGLLVAGKRLFANRQVFDTETGSVRELYLQDQAYPMSGAAYADGTFYFWRSINSGPATLVALRDIEPPVVQDLKPGPLAYTTSPTPSFSWTPGDGEGTGIASNEVILQGAPGSGSLPAETRTWQPGPLADGAYSWQVRVSDRVGNATTSPTRNLVVDTTPPGAFDLLTADGAALRTTSEAALRWTPAVDATSGIDRYEVLVDGRVATTVSASACGATACSSPPLVALTDGSHSVKVRAVDRSGLDSTTSTRTVSVAIPPTAAATATPGVTLTGHAVKFDASGSTDFNGSIAKLEWDLDGDGSFELAGGPTTSTSFASPGSHAVSVRLTDNSGLSSTTTVPVDVRPSPSQGEIGVSINNGDIATNNPRVQLSVVWPKFASHALISNDGGFGAQGGTSLLALSATMPWTLRSSGAERLPKTMYLRFRGAGNPDLNYTDDIILDETVPSLEQAKLTGVTSSRRAVALREWNPRLARARYRVRVVGSDVASGVSRIMVAPRKGARGAVSIRLRSRTKLGIRKLDKTVTVRMRRAPRWVRVFDSAGNPSRWRRI